MSARHPASTTRGRVTRLLALAAFASATVACQFYARSPEDYAKETEELVSTKKPQIKKCYDKVLKKDKKASGTVAVDFTVEKKTGKIVDPKVNKKKTDAPKSLQRCVLDAMDGLALDPPDQRDGMASFEYHFKANKPKQL